MTLKAHSATLQAGGPRVRLPWYAAWGSAEPRFFMPSRRHSILKVCVTTPMRGRPADDHWMVTSPLDTAQELHWRLSHYMRELTLQRDNAVIAADRFERRTEFEEP